MLNKYDHSLTHADSWGQLRDELYGEELYDPQEVFGGEIGSKNLHL